MRRPTFTAAELEEMRRADAEIERSFRWTPEEVETSRKRDREAELGWLDHKSRAIRERQRQYYEANRDAIRERQRQYYEANRERCLEYRRRYYEADRDAATEYQRRYREANKVKLAAAGAEISRCRKLHGLSQGELARLVGVCQTAVSQWERGAAPPRDGNWAALVRELPELEGRHAK